MNLKERIKSDFPKFPDEVIKVCMLPLAEKEGWPPSKESDWVKKIFGEGMNFWHEAEWKKIKTDLNQIAYSKMYYDAINGLRDAYISGVKNAYWNSLGENGKRRFQSCLKYILINSKFPVAPILLEDEQGKYQIMDGNHRFLAFVLANEAFDEYQQAPNEHRQKFLDTLKIESLSKPSSIQEIWICKPRWEESQNAATRSYLRKNGFNI